MKQSQSKGWMVYLGVVVVLVSLANGLVEANKAASGTDDIVLAESAQGFEPYLLPLVDTPTPSQTDEPSGELPVTEGTPSAISAGDATNETQIDALAEQEDVDYIPDRIVIPSIKLDAPVVPVDVRLITVEGQIYQQWKAPDEFATGWHPTSAMLGRVGNTVLNGHHNVQGKVFGNLVDVEVGDEIIVYSGTTAFLYEITNKMILPELNQPLEVRLQNARWLQPSDDERLTLVTCWPPDGNLDRLIVVAKPK